MGQTATELLPADGHKSFYGKAVVIENDHKIELRSYNTIIMGYNKDKKEMIAEPQEKEGKTIYVTDGRGWSATSNRHAKAFKQYLENRYGMEAR